MTAESLNLGRIARVLGIDDLDGAGEGEENANTIAWSLDGLEINARRIAVALERIADNLDEARR